MDFLAPTILGRTGLRVSRIGFGSSYGAPAKAYVRAFRDRGVNFFYWGSIRRSGMGEAVCLLAREGRDRIVVALQSYDRTGVLMAPFVERALRALRLDAADLLILGWHNKRPARRVVDAARGLVDSGRVRFLAVSGHDRPGLAAMSREEDLPLDAVMVRYNAAHRGAEVDLFPHLPGSRRPGTISYTATRWGQLLDPRRVPAGEAPLRASDCYRFALSHPAVDVCLSGPADEAQVAEALLALERGPLDAAEMDRVRRIGGLVRAGRTPGTRGGSGS